MSNKQHEDASNTEAEKQQIAAYLRLKNQILDIKMKKALDQWEANQIAEEELLASGEIEANEERRKLKKVNRNIVLTVCLISLSSLLSITLFRQNIGVFISGWLPFTLAGIIYLSLVKLKVVKPNFL